MKTRHTAIALAIAAASLSAHADLARVGPANLPSPAGHGFPLWYQDLNGMVLDLCLPDANDPGAAQQNACLLVGPGLPDPPYSFPNNFPDEAFYFNATSVMDMPAGKRATLVTALEAAFSVGDVAVGDQVVFTRIRVFAGVPEPGTYTVTHPYGVDTFPVDAVGGGNRDIVFSEDVGVARGDFNGALKSRVGPFLQRSLSSGGLPEDPVTLNGAQFLSDGVATEFVTGSPFGTNYFEICGVRDDSSVIDLNGEADGTCMRSDQFSLMGRLHNFVTNPIPSPLDIYSSFYKRDAAGTQVDVYARNIKALPNQPDPLLTAAAANIPPVKMIPFGPPALGEFYSQGLVNPNGDLPGPVSVINSADNPPSIFTKHAVDVVTAASVNFDYPTDTLTVIATSSDKGFGAHLPPALTIDGYGITGVSTNNPNDPAEKVMTVTGVGTPPATVTVKSAAGGSGTFTLARNQITAGIGAAPGPGVPLAIDDGAAAEAGGAAIDIPVTANDVANPAALITSLQLVGPAIPAGSGSATVNGTSITYTPGSVNGDVTFQYTASNSVGQSNVATVVVTVAPSAAGPAPIVNPDGPVVVAVSQSTVIDVLANDLGNGGTLDPASVSVTNVTGGTTSVNTANGQVTFLAGATAGTFGFDYTVANDNGQVSPPAHVTVTVVNAEDIQITKASCKPINATSGEWRVTGTSTVQTNNSIQLYLTASVPADLNTNELGAAVPVVAGAWDFKAKPGPACKTPISLISSATGATRSNIAVTIR